MSADFRFARRPWWVVLHVLVLVAVLVMIRLGFWQLDRLHGKQELADTLTAREGEPAVAIDSLGDAADSADVAEDLSYRSVTATGEYLVDEEVLVANRTQEGLPGYWVVTPLRLNADEAVAVLRGFVPLTVGDDRVPVPAVAPPSGRIAIDGWVLGTAERGLLGGSDDRPGTLERYNRLDLERLAEQVSVPLLPVAVVATDQRPATEGDALQPVPLPEPDLGPHAGYAGQWFLFALVFAVGYPLILRRQARSERGGGHAGSGDAPASIPC